MSLKITNTIEEEFGDILEYLLQFYTREKLENYMDYVNNLRAQGIDI